MGATRADGQSVASHVPIGPWTSMGAHEDSGPLGAHNVTIQKTAN